MYVPRKTCESPPNHSFQNRTRPGGWTVKTENRDENRFFKPKEPDFLLILWTPKTEVGLHEPVARTMRSNPLAIKKKKNKQTNKTKKQNKTKQLNSILFYLIKLSISYKELKKIIIKILQRYSTLLQKLIINFNVFMVIILFY